MTVIGNNNGYITNQPASLAGFITSHSAQISHNPSRTRLGQGK